MGGTVDPVSMVVGALAAGAADGLTSSATAAVADAYAALRDRLRSLFAGNSQAVEVLDRHGQDPELYQEPLRLMLVRSGAMVDAEVLAAARTLLAEADPDGFAGGKYRVEVRGSQGVQVGDGNEQHNSFGAPPEQW